MNTSIPQKLSFWKAFRFALYKVKPERLAPYFDPEKDLPYVAKSYEHSFFFIWAGPFLAIFFAWLYGPGLHGGPITPEVPTFEVIGYITRPTIARNPDYTIHTKDGKTFVIGNRDLPHKYFEDVMWPYVSKENEPKRPEVKLEGFLLKNGTGTFYPIKAMAMDGSVLNDPELAMKNLHDNQKISWIVAISGVVVIWSFHAFIQLFSAFGFIHRNRKYLKASLQQTVFPLDAP